MTPEQSVKAKHFATSGYRVEPTSNGGFIVLRDGGQPGMRHESAAFTTGEDLLQWLRVGHAAPEPTFVVQHTMLRR
jgi:hypothetical protein